MSDRFDPSGFRAGGAWGQARFAREVMARRTGLPVRLGLGTALLVGVLPMVLIVLLAVLCGGLVFLVAALLTKATAAVGLHSPRPRDVRPPTQPIGDGRENVRVMRRPGD